MGLFVVNMAIGLSSSSKVVNDLSDGNGADSCYHVQDAENLFSGDEKILTISDFKVMGPNSYSAFMSFINVSKNPNIDSIYAKKEFPDFKHVLS